MILQTCRLATSLRKSENFHRLVVTGTNPLKWFKVAMDRWEDRGKLESFTFQEITFNQTVQLISKLENSTSFGTDSIDALAIKAAAVSLAPPIRHLINVSLTISVYANKCKLAKLVPLLKSSELDRLHPESYRPIAILPTVSKLVEKAAQIQLLTYMEDNRLLNNSSHAYRQGHSTTTTILDLTDKIFEAIDENKMASIMTLDQSTAFNCVPHPILLEKLKMYNLDAKSIQWIDSYLNFRTQFVAIGRSRSRMCKVERGVPQGSVLGPLLYSIFTNEITEAVTYPNCQDKVHKDRSKLFCNDCKTCGSVTQYADDATYVVANRKRELNQTKLTDNISRLKTFLNSNELTINMDKTHLMEIMIKQKRGRTPGQPPELIVLNSSQQEEVVSDSKYCRILGINVQNNFTWNAHLETGAKALLPSLRKSLGALKVSGKQVPTGSRNTLARGLLLNRITYLISVWGGGTQNLIRKAQTLQNAASRWVTNGSRKTRISTLLEQTGWLSITEITQVNSTTLIWNMLNKQTPRRLSEKIQFDPTTKKITTREPILLFTRQKFL